MIELPPIDYSRTTRAIRRKDGNSVTLSDMEEITKRVRRYPIVLEALKQAIEIIDDIAEQECCDYGHGVEIEKLRMVSQEISTCPYLNDPDHTHMCKLQNVYCIEQFANCKENMAL